MKAIVGYGISIVRKSQEYETLLETYPWLAIHPDDYINAEVIMNDAIDEELEVALWWNKDGDDGIFIAMKDCLAVKDESDYANGEVDILFEPLGDDTDITNFCLGTGREPKWILLCVE